MRFQLRKFLAPAFVLLLLASFVPAVSAGIDPSVISVSLELDESKTHTLTFLNPENENVDVKLEILGEGIKPFVNVEEPSRTVGPYDNAYFTLTFKGLEVGTFGGFAIVAGEWIPIFLTVHETAETAQASVTTQPAISITQTSAILNASISRKNYLPVDIWFGWRAVGGAWQNTPIQSSYTVSSYSYYLAGLTPGTTYEFKAWISFEGLENSGSVLPFTTLPSPELGTLNVMLISLGDGFTPIPILSDLPFALTTIASGFNLIYVTDSETDEPVDADVTLNFFTLGLWGGAELDPMIMFMMLQGGGFGGLFGMGLEVPVTDGMGVLFLPDGVEFAHATVSSGGYKPFGFFLRISETGETEAVGLSVSAPGDPTAGLVGISVNVDGEPAEDADVYVDGGHQGETDAEGNCTVTLEKGPHTIRVEYQDLEQSAGITAWEAMNTHIELQEGQVSIGDAIRGKLVDDKYGNPVQNTRMVLGEQSSFTGADGGFELSTEGIEAGTHSVFSEHRFDSTAHISYTSSSANIEITHAGTSWWQYVVAILVFVVFLRVAIAARRRGWLSELSKFKRGIKRYPT